MNSTRTQSRPATQSRLETIGSAAAGIAHDINNQLTLIVNHLALRDLESAQHATERCSALTASLLAYCKDDPLDVAPTNPVAFLKNFVRYLQLPEGIELRLNIPVLLPSISADPLALTRVLTNVIDNACDAMEGRGTLRITASPWAIVVSDTGGGISVEFAKRIFDPFFSTKGAKGSGLGLSIARDLMRQQDGTITVYSEPGRGARFTLQFRKA
jgi:two-component system, NtrC family, sensor kinase